MDVGSDIYVTIQYGLRGETYWFALTLSFIIVPLFIVSLTVTWKTSRAKDLELRECCLMFSCISIFVRYAKEFKRLKRIYRNGSRDSERSEDDGQDFDDETHEYNKSAFEFATIRYTQTMTECTLQWCLQVYIMLHQWYFPWYTLLSVTFSLISLSWSITTLEKAQETNQRRKFTQQRTAVFFTVQLFSLLSRLLTIAVFAYVFKNNVFTALAVHLLFYIVLFWLDNGCPDSSDLSVSFLLNTVWCFPLLFHAREIFIKEYNNPLLKFFVHGLLCVENIGFAVLAMTILKSEATHMDVLGPIVLACAITSSVLGTSFLIANKKDRRQLYIQHE